MTSRLARLSMAAPVLLLLSACSAATGADETPSATGGAIELAVSETCTHGSDAQCIAVNGQYVVLPSAFERAGVEDAAVTDGEGQNAVGVTFTDDGAEILHALTEKAAGAGSTARLVMKIGDEIQAAVAVMQAIEGNYVQIALSPDDSAPDLVDLIRAG